jgi:hypothetical protein
VFHFCLASLFVYLFVRQRVRYTGARVPAARFAGAVAAIAFTYGGYLTSFPVQQVTILETAVWLPLVLTCLDRAARYRNRLTPSILAGLALACALLAGHPQTAMYVAYATLAYGLFLVFAQPSPRLARNALWGVVYLVVLPLGTGGALAAIQLGPTLAFIIQSTRAGLDYQTVSWGFPLNEVTHLLYPGYFGGSPQYVGILTLVLVAAAIWVLRLRRDVIFWLSLAAITFLLAFGRHTFVYDVAYLLLPGFRAVRNQERIIYLFGFAASVLAGYGALLLVQPLLRPERRALARFARAVTWGWVVLLAITALFYGGYLLGVQQGAETNLFEGMLRHHVLLLLILGGGALTLWLRVTGRTGRGWLTGLTLVLLALNLFTINWQYNLADPAAGGPFPSTGLVRFLQEREGVHRISSAGLLPGGSSAGIVYQLEDITGNTPLRLERFERLEESVGSWRRWQLLNVHYVLSDRELDGPGLERVYEEGGVRAYQMGDPLPRAWVAGDVIVATDDETLVLLNAEDFDPRAQAIVPPGTEIAASGGAGSARVLRRPPGELVLEVSATGPGLLVVSQPFYPGWQAQVDGVLRPIIRADYLLQGVPIAAGSQRVVLTYKLSPVPAGISLTALIGCAVLVLLSHRWKSARMNGNRPAGSIPPEEP